MKLTPQEKAVNALRKLFLNAIKDDNAKALWRLVTALRGPDSDDCVLKDRLTTPIRKALLTREFAIEVGVSESESFPFKPRWHGADIEEGQDHYRSHIRVAQRVLNEATVMENERKARQKSPKA